MNLAPATPITGAVTGVVITPGPTAAGGFVRLNSQPRSLTAQVNFVYGSGGTTVTVYIQISLDGGATWIDVMAFGFTTSSLKKAMNVTARTPITTPPAALNDGALTSNTAQDGILGPLVRAKLTTTGTYAGGTTVQVDIASDQLQN